MINKRSKIFIAGHNGMVGSACLNLLEKEGFLNIVTLERDKLDLTKENEVSAFFERERPDLVINAAAKVGGIWANNEFPYEFLMNNLLIQNNLIRASHHNNVKKFIFLGSSCIYPKMAKQPITEEELLTSPLEETNQWYAIAKIAGVKLCEAIFSRYGKQFISLMPTNLYGPNDNFDEKVSHVLPAMIRKFHDAKINRLNQITLWGDGNPIREFLHVYDLAKAILFTTENEMEDHIYNVGSGVEIKIIDLANTVKNIIGFNGEVKWDSSMPNGTPRKLLDSSRFNSKGWEHEISIDEGIKSTYQWFLKNFDKN